MMPIAVKGHMPFCPPIVNNAHSTRPINIPRDHRRETRSKTNSLPILGCEKASPVNLNSRSAPILKSDEDVHKKIKDDGNFFKSMIAFFKRKKSKEKSKSSGSIDMVDGKISRVEFDALVKATVAGSNKKYSLSPHGHVVLNSGDVDSGDIVTIKKRSNSLNSNSPYRTRLAAIREEDERTAPSTRPHHRKNLDLPKTRPVSDPFDRKSQTFAQYLGISDSESSCDSIIDALQFQV